jgi:hypothetical protein
MRFQALLLTHPLPRRDSDRQHATPFLPVVAQRRQGRVSECSGRTPTDGLGSASTLAGVSPGEQTMHRRA